MKFVHLAPRDVVSMIRRRGLRMGNGLLGRGVYAVPLFRLRRFSIEQRDEYDTFDDWSECDFSVPRSSHDLWRFLFAPDLKRGLRAIAVMFEPPAEAWPVEVRLDLWAHMTAEFVRGLKHRPIEGVTVTVEMLRYTRRARTRRCGSREPMIAFVSRASGVSSAPRSLAADRRPTRPCEQARRGT